MEAHGLSGGLGEDALHAIFRSSYAGRKGVSGPGDDCALLRPPAGRAVVHSVDQLAEGVHVERGTAPALMARKLLRRALSDLAAVGAEPWAVSWTVAAPPARGGAWLKRLARAFLAEAAVFRVAVAGGDVSRADALVLTATVFGLAPAAGVPGRGGGRPGDVLLVTGALGDAIASGRHLLPEPRLREGARLVERYRPHAMMDLSDGLARDLPRLCAASGVGASVRLEDLPLAPGLAAGEPGWRAALGDGEDYELLLALPPRRAAEALQDRVLRRTGLRAMGSLEEGATVRWLTEGRRWRPGKLGWQH